MSTALVAGNFVRSAFRLPIRPEGNLARVARNHYNSVREAMEVERLYSRFEMTPNGELLCIFSEQSGILLGETVRDWVLSLDANYTNFLWCEKLDDEFLLVCVLDGQVVKESYENTYSITTQVQQLIRRAKDRGAEFRVFLYNILQSDLLLNVDLPVTRLDVSILTHIKHVGTRSLPRLHSYSAAIAKIAQGWILIRIAMIGLLIAALVLPSTYFLAQWWLGGAVDNYTQDYQLVKSSTRNYNALLTQPDSTVLLPAIHKASLDILLDSQLAQTWRINELRWTRDLNILKVSLSLPKLTDALGEPIALSPELKEKLRADAAERGWSMRLRNNLISLEIPITAEPRAPDGVHDLRRFEPQDPRDRWHFKRLERDLEPVGTLSSKPQEGRRTDLYYTQPATFKFTGDPWQTGTTARWLAQRLSNGPLVIDEVRLITPDSSRGGLMDGTVKFQMLWRIR